MKTDNLTSLKTFLQTRPSLTPHSLEKEAEIAQGTLAKALSGERGISKKVWARLLPILIKYGYAEKPV